MSAKQDAAPPTPAKAPRKPASRRTNMGDTAPKDSPDAIENFEINEAVDAARDAKLSAVSDIVATLARHDTHSIAETLQAIMAGASPDDANILRKALLAEDEAVYKKLPSHPDDELADGWREGAYPYRNLMSRKAYEKQKYRLQVELLKLQAWVKETGQRVVILFEGRDAAGKGGTIKRFMEHLNPRGAKVVALEKPTETERGQWYFQRYVQHLPTAGEIALFDRSWYNRAMVEPVFGFCTDDEYRNFIRGVVGFEKDLVRQGTILLKLYFSVTKEEQRRRFDRRRTDPLRQWKLSEIDVQAQEHWDDFTDMKYRMLKKTSTSEAPWWTLSPTTTCCAWAPPSRACRWSLQDLAWPLAYRATLVWSLATRPPACLPRKGCRPSCRAVAR